MTPVRYILRSLLHHRFAYLGVFVGAILGATVLLGALFAGDSVEASLLRIGENRTGRATHVLTAGDRAFRQGLADDLARATQARAVPVMYARGTAAHAATGARANQVQLVGVTAAFWQLAPQPATVALNAATSAVAVNDTLARRLGISAGDTLVVRMQKPGILAGNAPVAGAESTLQTIRCTVATVVDDASFGRFSLETTQLPQPSVFLPISLLQEALSQPEKANLLLIDAAGATAGLHGALARVVQLADYGLALKWLEKAAAFELTSDRIFIDPDVADAVMGALSTAQPVLSYLVNELQVRDNTTPYSIATATTREAAPFLPPDLGPRQIVINEWLAEDLQARPGDEVRLTYFQTGGGGALVEQSTAFHVRSIVPLQGLAADSAWMPDFPGISDVDTPGDWDPGLPLDLNRIRDQDERYWDEFRGAPKAFVSLEAGRGIWSTRWGSHTALRIPMERDREAGLTGTLLGALRPEMNQLLLREFRASAQAAAESPVDFAGLFMGMSFFLIAAAVGLVAMLFQLTLLQRNREDALLGAVGLPARTLLRWRMAEGFALLLLACAAGAALASLYTRGILRFLESIWAGQAAGSTFVFAAQPASLAAGCAGFLVLSLLAIWLAIRKQARRTLSVRLAAHAEEISPPPTVRRSSLVAAGAALAIAALAIALSGRGLAAQGAFYIAGFALLAAGIAACRWWMALATAPERDSEPSASRLGGLNIKARRARSVTVVGLIATAVFMVLSVASFRKQIGDDWLERGSGTGGFAFWVETTAALNPARDGRSDVFEVFETHAAELAEIVPLRAGVGDNVNCFNLNATAQPRLLAVDAATLARLNAFRLKIASSHASGDDGAARLGSGGNGSQTEAQASSLSRAGPRQAASNLSSSSDRTAPGWNTLRTAPASGAIPAFVDETTLQWALKRKVGDVLVYEDENGKSFDVQIAGTIPDSIFQGHLIVDEQPFLEHFPSNPGYSVFLIDARSQDSAELVALRDRLQAATRDAGGRVELTRDVLAAFHQIENTYIGIFNVLGSLGVILGSLGLAIVVARNLRERRGEFAVMTAIGIPRAVLARMVFSEFGRLVVWGIAIGVAASAIAIWPNMAALPPAQTFILVAGLLAGIVALNIVSGWMIFRWSVRDLRPGVEQAAA